MASANTFMAAKVQPQQFEVSETCLMMRFTLLALLAFLGIGVYLLFFSPSQRKADYVYNHKPFVKAGMSENEVKALLTEPDTTYYWIEGQDSALVLNYNMGFGAPDGLRILLHRDSVIDVQYNQ